MSILDALFGPGTWGTGGNLVAWGLCGVLGAIGMWLGRNLIGKHLAAWWSKHHGEYAVKHHLEALRRHEQEKAPGIIFKDGDSQ